MILSHKLTHTHTLLRHLLSSAKRAQAVSRLSCILQHQPSDQSAMCSSSLDILPFSLANSLKKNSCLGQLVSGLCLGISHLLPLATFVQACHYRKTQSH